MDDKVDFYAIRYHPRGSGTPISFYIIHLNNSCIHVLGIVHPKSGINDLIYEKTFDGKKTKTKKCL